MKFVCMKCESFMTFENVQKPGEQSLGVTFGCPTCGAKVAMVTNPGETAMVNALGVKLGGRETSAQPMELTRESLKEGVEAYTPAVQKEMLEKETAKTSASGGGTCPFSSMMAQMQGATPSSETSTTQIAWTQDAKERIEKVPSFMRPMIQMGVESYARRKGYSEITPEVMDLSKTDPGEMAWSKEAENRLENIPSFIRPMAKKEIERMAKERGQTQVSESLLEEAKSKFIGMGY